MPLMIKLSVVFLIIGSMSFGGGYAVLSLIQNQMMNLGWLDAKAFSDIAALSQVTPGPIGINAATFVGYNVLFRDSGSYVMAVIGSAVATVAIVLVPTVLILIVAKFYNQYKKTKIFGEIMNGIRPATVGLILLASFSFLEMSVFSKSLLAGGFATLNVFSLAIFLIVLIFSFNKKISPFLLILLSAVLGIVFL